jgi:Leucine-rich repeat (LRR) protein
MRVSEIPTEVGLMTSLTRMNVYSNHFMGKIPIEIVLLTRLATLNLGIKKFTGSVPSELGSLSQLEFVGFQDNDLVGRGGWVIYFALITLINLVPIVLVSSLR